MGRFKKNSDNKDTTVENRETRRVNKERNE